MKSVPPMAVIPWPDISIARSPFCSRSADLMRTLRLVILLDLPPLIMLSVVLALDMRDFGGDFDLK